MNPVFRWPVMGPTNSHIKFPRKFESWIIIKSKSQSGITLNSDGQSWITIISIIVNMSKAEFYLSYKSHDKKLANHHG